MHKISTALIVFAGLVNFVPLIGVVSADRLQALYGLAFENPNLQLLMRHRAVLFGIAGGLMIGSAFYLPPREAQFNNAVALKQFVERAT